jgi:hypothetical protein
MDPTITTTTRRIAANMAAPLSRMGQVAHYSGWSTTNLTEEKHHQSVLFLREAANDQFAACERCCA